MPRLPATINHLPPIFRNETLSRDDESEARAALYKKLIQEMKEKDKDYVEITTLRKNGVLVTARLNKLGGVAIGW
jgi:hypothetical protein